MTARPIPAVTRTKSDPNRSFREDALVAEIERLQAVADAAAAYRKEADGAPPWRWKELYTLGVALDTALAALAGCPFESAHHDRVICPACGVGREAAGG